MLFPHCFVSIEGIEPPPAEIYQQIYPFARESRVRASTTSVAAVTLYTDVMWKTSQLSDFSYSRIGHKTTSSTSIVVYLRFLLLRTVLTLILRTGGWTRTSGLSIMSAAL